MENGNKRQGRSKEQYRSSAIGAFISIIGLTICLILVAGFQNVFFQPIKNLFFVDFDLFLDIFDVFFARKTSQRSRKHAQILLNTFNKLQKHPGVSRSLH